LSGSVGAAVATAANARTLMKIVVGFILLLPRCFITEIRFDK
jgi:hypothetical protein